MVQAIADLYQAELKRQVSSPVLIPGWSTPRTPVYAEAGRSPTFRLKLSVKRRSVVWKFKTGLLPHPPLRGEDFQEIWTLQLIAR